jgi:hypothetical protein
MTLQELRSIALSATQGCDKIERVDLDSGYIIYNIYGSKNIASCCEIANENARNDAKFIASFNTKTILALIAVIEAADSMRASLTLGRDDVTVQPYDAVRERLEEILEK